MSHVLELGVDIATGHPAGAWELGTAGFSELGVTTYLAASDTPPGIWEPLDFEIVEVTWTQGTSSRPSRVVPRPDPGTCTLVLIDPYLSYLPSPSQLTSGLRPGRLLRVVDGSDDHILWMGTVESASWDVSHADPLHHLTITAVDGLSRLARAGQVDPDERGVETAAARAQYLMDTYAPEQAVLIDPDATRPVAATIQQSVWDALVDAADAELGWLWVRRDGLVDMGAEDGLVNPGASWLLTDPCLPVAYQNVTADQMGWATRWTVQRRNPSGAAGVPQTVIRDDVEAVYGTWQDKPLDSYPVPTDPDALRIAEVAAQWRGWPRLSTAALSVNVAAAAHLDGLPLLLDLVRTMQLGDVIDAPAAGLPESFPLLVVGWTWTWAGVGSLNGTINLELSPADSLAAGYWQLGTIGASELDVTTQLAPAEV